MATEVILPKVDPGMTGGTIIEWLKEEGSSVEKGEILFLLETEKVVLEIESPATGILGKFLYPAGQTVSVGSVVTYILEPGEKMPAASAKRDGDMFASDSTDKISRISTKGVSPDLPSPVRASPLARKIAKENHLDLSRIKGTGPGGRIIKEDVLRTIEARTIEAESKAPTKAITPISVMRRTMARRLTESFQFTPHFYLSVEVTVEKLNEIRKELIPYVQKVSGVRLSYTDLLLKIVSQAIEHHPEINVSWRDERIVRKNDINLGVAVGIEDGLIVPVIHRANTRSLIEIAKMRSDLVKRAREGALTLGDLQDGSMTITNLGMFGIDHFSAVINPPESCILAVGSINKKPVADGDGIALKLQMALTLSIDHRVIDGIVGSRFLNRIKELIENPVYLIAE